MVLGFGTLVDYYRSQIKDTIESKRFKYLAVRNVQTNISINMLGFKLTSIVTYILDYVFPSLTNKFYLTV